MKSEWDREVERVWHPEYDHILEEIDSLFKVEQKRLAKELRSKKKKKKKVLKKNLELTQIYLPRKDFKLLEKLSAFKRLHNLGGIPCSMIEEGEIRIDVEVVNPRKRKRKTVIYVREESSK